jgi:hypothetical protein
MKAIAIDHPEPLMSNRIPYLMRTGCLLLVSLILAACKPGVDPTAGPLVEVWKSPTCSCCSKWVEHLKANGFRVEVHNEGQMNPLKTKLGIPQGLASCHTARVDGYLVEGHVPASDIKRLLAERPAGRGIAVPDMPIGSPGMEQGDRQDPFDVVLFGDNDQRQVFATHGRAEKGEVAADSAALP